MFLRIFGYPLLLGVATTIGLVSALVGDDAWDVLSWLALGSPVAVICWYLARPAARAAVHDNSR
jgi:hypothetical protein